MGCEISTCQMQYDANNKETDKNNPCFIYSGGNGPRKCRSILGSLSQMICDGIHVSNICTTANRTLGNLYACPQEVKEAAYKGLVCPGLEYSGSVWDPSGVSLHFQTLLSPLLKVLRIVLLSSLLWWELWTTPYATSFMRFFAYHHAVERPHTTIILPWFSIPLVLKGVANILKIGLQIKT